jgi:hypothetical protein
MKLFQTKTNYIQMGRTLLQLRIENSQIKALKEEIPKPSLKDIICCKKKQKRDEK